MEGCGSGHMRVCRVEGLGLRVIYADTHKVKTLANKAKSGSVKPSNSFTVFAGECAGPRGGCSVCDQSFLPIASAGPCWFEA